MFISADQILAHLLGDYIRPSLAGFAFIVATHFVIDRWRLARYVVWVKNFLAPRRRFLLFWFADRDTEHDVWRAPDEAAPADYHEYGYEHRRNHPWSACRATGYSAERPAWLATWLLIIADNTLHLICNAVALRWF